MSYDYLKVLHVISAALLLTSMGYSYWLWRQITHAIAIVSDRLQTQTWSIVIPLAIFQLITGFTMISLKHYDFNQLWIKASVIGFLCAMTSWFAFIYCVLSRQQHRRLQSSMLFICAVSLFSMIFFMSNRVT